MAFELVTVPCLQDNYAFLIHDRDSGATAVVDVPEAPPILAALTERGWTLSEIWLTHHHWDHIDGVPALVKATGARVIGAAADADRLPPLDMRVGEGKGFSFAGAEVQVFDVSGHTINHIAFYVPAMGAVFTADSLMALGCGRLFEGTPAQMWASLSKLAALPPETLVCSGHEYTQSNARFAVTVEPANKALIARVKTISKAREQGIPTVPSTLAEELETNPFLRAHLPEMKAAVGMPAATDAEAFGEIRARKDKF